MSTSRREAESRTSYQVPDGLRDKDLSHSGQSRHTGPDMDRNTAYLFPQVFALPRVKSGPDLDTESSYDVADRHCTPDRACRTIKRGEEAVPGRVLLFAPETSRLPPYQRVVGA